MDEERRRRDTGHKRSMHAVEKPPVDDTAAYRKFNMLATPFSWRFYGNTSALHAKVSAPLDAVTMRRRRLPEVVATMPSFCAFNSR